MLARSDARHARCSRLSLFVRIASRRMVACAFASSFIDNTVAGAAAGHAPGRKKIQCLVCELFSHLNPHEFLLSK